MRRTQLTFTGICGLQAADAYVEDSCLNLSLLTVQKL